MKMQILHDVDSGTKKKVAEKYGIVANTLSTILKVRKNIEESFEGTAALASSRKRLRKCTFPDVEEALLAWFNDVRRGIYPSQAPCYRKSQRT